VFGSSSIGALITKLLHLVQRVVTRLQLADKLHLTAMRWMRQNQSRSGRLSFWKAENRHFAWARVEYDLFLQLWHFYFGIHLCPTSALK
jgi:hypothetical protein